MHVVYDHLSKDGTVIEVACWAHQSLYFKVLESDHDRAKFALSRIAALFQINSNIFKHACGPLDLCKFGSTRFDLLRVANCSMLPT